MQALSYFIKPSSLAALSLLILMPLPALSQGINLRGVIEGIANEIIHRETQDRQSSDQRTPEKQTNPPTERVPVQQESPSSERYPSQPVQRAQAQQTNPRPVRQPEQTVDIRSIQQNLAQLGYSPGVADGLMGPNTRRAIQQFQRDQGIAINGVASAQLLERLRSVTSAQQSGPTIAERTPKPSFDCSRASTSTEFAICSNPDLVRLDRLLAEAYEEARADASNPSEVISDQRSWISLRNACAGDSTCLRASMEDRLAALEGAYPTVASPNSEVAAPSDVSTVRAESPQTTPEGDQSAGFFVRDNDIRIHPSGRLIVPWPVNNTHSTEGQEYQALKRLLRHAVVAEQIADMTPADHPAFFADIARDYLSSSEFHPFFCTPDEITSDAPGCINDANWYYMSAGGGQMDKTAEHPYLWWRGSNEFERQRNMSSFAESGLVEKVIASAPDMPIKLLYSIDVHVNSYDFEAEHFPVRVHPGISGIKPPGDYGGSFDLAEYARQVSVPPAAAEALMRRLPKRNDGDVELTLGIEMDIAIQEPDRAPRRLGWEATVISAAYFLDDEATQPLVAEIESVTGESATTPEVATNSGTGGAAPDSVMRQFSMHLEEGRIVIDFRRDGQLTQETQEAIHYLFASAARDFVEAATGDLARYRFPVLFSILNDEVRTRYFDCSSINNCYNRKTNSYFTGENEFEARQAHIAFDEEVAPNLVAEAPTLPIPMRLYLNARLSEYDFDKEGFGVRASGAGPEIDSLPQRFNAKPIVDLVPDFISMSPDSAERIVNAVNGDPVLRIDYDVLHFRLLENHIETVTKVRPVEVALMTGEGNDSIHFEQTYASTDQENGQGEAHGLLGPDIEEMSSPQEPTAYLVVGVAPGMTLEAAVDALSQSYSEAEITVEKGILRAERGYCGYDGTGSGVNEDELGAICFVARLKDQRISRVAFQQIVHPGEMRTLNDEMRRRYGAPDSRGDGDVPADSMLREYFGWGEELAATRAMLGRPEIGIPVHEAEADHIYVNPRVAVSTLRVDAPPALVVRSAEDSEPPQTSEKSSPATEIEEGRVSDGG